MDINQVIKNSNNIINFPRANVNIRDISNLTKEQVDEHIEILKHYIVDEIIKVIIQSAFNSLAVMGYPIDNDIAKDGALFTETLRSMLLKYYNVSHPLQDLAEQIFEINDDDDLTLVGKLTIINTHAVAVGNT